VALDDAGLLEQVEALGEEGAGDQGQALADLVEAGRAGE
jgi:hypothetical protein